MPLSAWALVTDKPATAAEDKIPAPDNITLFAGEYALTVARKTGWTFRTLSYQGKTILVPTGWMQPVLNVKVSEGKTDFIGTGHGGELVSTLELTSNGAPVPLKPDQSEYRAADGAALVLTKRSRIGPYEHRSVLELSPTTFTQNYFFEIKGDTQSVNYLYAFMHIFAKAMSHYRMDLSQGESLTGVMPDVTDVEYLPGQDKVASISMFAPTEGLAAVLVFSEPIASRQKKGHFLVARPMDNKFYSQVTPSTTPGDKFEYHLKLRCTAATLETFPSVTKDLVDDLSKNFAKKPSPATKPTASNEPTTSTDTVTFDASQLKEPRRGNVGFLHGIFPNVLPHEWVTDLKPTLWRGFTSHRSTAKPEPGLLGIEGFKYLRDTILVPRQLMVVQELIRNEPYKSMVANEGLEAASAALARDAKTGGYQFEWDVINEPVIAEGGRFADMEQFMNEVWNPTVRGIRSVDPKAKIHGPSLTFVSAYNQGCHEKLFDLLTRAHAAGTLPNYVNWHCQDGYDIAKAHGILADEIRAFYRDHHTPLDGMTCGETVRPGDERNTSPAVAIDVFATAEIHNVDQIRACWGSVKVYDQDLNRIPTLCGLLNKDWTGRRGVWWTHRFYSQSKGRRIACIEGPSGSEHLVALGFADLAHSKLRLMVGLRDGVQSSLTASIKVSYLSEVATVAKNGTVKVSIWENPQTEGAVTLEKPTQSQRIAVIDNTVTLTANLAPWGAALIEIAP
ncbi:MAG: hypothetical protein ABL974_00205 [Prosthecobacter sp.]